MKTCIIAGGMLEREFVLRFMGEQKFDIILAADRGLEFCNEENIRPTYILGDFDSLKDGVLEKYRQENQVPIREFNPVKDNTDMDLALQQAIILGSSEIYILGGTGGRLDHFFSTVQNLKKGSAGLLAALQEEAQNSFEERKRNAREEGERAGTRLLLPMMMMLAVVMVLILVPACFSFAGM